MDLYGEKGNLIEELDPRMKLLIVILITVMTFITESTVLFMYYYALIFVLIFTSKLYKSGVRLFLFISILFILQLLGENIQNKEFRDSYITIVILIQRLSVFMAMGIWASSKMKVGTFVTALENMRLPKGMTIMIAVVLRYIPTVKQEFYYIKSTMELRGIGLNFKNIILHPIKTFEYSFVPLIIRCMTIADELSASTMTRGLDLDTKRVPIIDVKIKAVDVVVTVSVVSLFVAGMIIYRKLNGELL